MIAPDAAPSIFQQAFRYISSSTTTNNKSRQTKSTSSCFYQIPGSIFWLHTMWTDGRAVWSSPILHCSSFGVRPYMESKHIIAYCLNVNVQQFDQFYTCIIDWHTSWSPTRFRSVMRVDVQTCPVRQPGRTNNIICTRSRKAAGRRKYSCWHNVYLGPVPYYWQNETKQTESKSLSTHGSQYNWFDCSDRGCGGREFRRTCSLAPRV